MNTRMIRWAGRLALATGLAALAACGGGNPTAAQAPAGTSAATESDAAATPRRMQALAIGPAAAVPTQRLTVTVPTGGRVFSVPAGVDCGSVCSADVEQGRTVSLRAVPAPGYVFDGWQGSCSDPTACSVVMDGARSVSARFAVLNPLAECTVTRSTSTVAQIAASHPKVLLAQAELKACLQHQMSLAAPAAVRMKNYVDAQMAGGNIYGFEPWVAALVYQATGDVRYADYAVQRTDAAVAAEEARIAAGQGADVAGDSYLYVGEIIGGLATVYDWAYDRLTPQQRSRWIAYANQAVWNVWNPSQASWGGRSFPWSGWSVDNPANNYYYSFLRATVLLGLATHGENAQAPTWITRFRTDKIQNQLLPMFNSQLQGGGSREGTGYGTAMRGLWELYDWWERSTGERIASLTPHTRDSIAHLLHNMTPTLDRLAPTGDHARDSSAALFDYHRHYLQALIALYPQDRLSAVARSALDQSTVPRMRYSYDYYADYLYALPVMPAESLSALSTAYWGSGTGQLMMRSGWDPAATYSNFICGPFTESHAHRDQGSFVLFRGDWLAWDRNIVSQSGIEQGEELHNLVRLQRANGTTITQRVESPPCRMLALAHNEHFTYAVADVTPIYGGASAAANGVGRVEREFLFLRPSTVVVMDRVVATQTGTSKIWMLNLPGQPTLSPGRMSYAAQGNSLDVFGLAPAGVTGRWVAGSRVEVSDSADGQSNFLHVLGTNGSVSQAVRDDSVGTIGARISLADGRTAVVRFNSGSGSGGTLELRRADGSLIQAGALPSTVQAPPLFAGDAPPPPAAVTVALVSPVNGASFPAPASFKVTAAVSPADQVLRVELWRNGQKVAEDSSAPYEFAQSALGGGLYQFDARAVRSDGAVTTSTSVTVEVTNPAPPPVTVSLTSPATGTQVNLGTAVNFDAHVQGTALLGRIDYLANGTVVATRTDLPWTASWTPPGAGTWSLQARLTLGGGTVIHSATSTLTVVAVAPPAATLALTSPAPGSQVSLGTATVLAAAVQGNVSIARVDFLANGAVVGARSAAPWTLSWTAPALGSWVLQARASLADGRIISSAMVGLAVVAPPPPPPAGNEVVFRQGQGGYGGTLDLGVSNQYVQYNGGKGVVSNDEVSGAYRISGSDGYEVHSFLRFDGLSVLQGRRVVKAELSLSFNFGHAGYTLAGHYLATPWDPGSGSFGWTRRDGSHRWAVKGSGGSDWISGKSFQLSGFTGHQVDTHTVALDVDVVQSWIDQASANQGLVLTPTVAGKVSWMRTSEDPVTAYRPSLKLWLE
jgi:hypothetical protein